MAQSVFGGQLSSPVTGGLAISRRDAFWGFARQLGTAAGIVYFPGMPWSQYRHLKHGFNVAKASISSRGTIVGARAWQFASEHPRKTIFASGGLSGVWTEGVNRQFNPIYWQSQIIKDMPFGQAVDSAWSYIKDSRRGGDLLLSSRSGPRPLDPRNPILVMRVQVPKIPLGRGGTPVKGKIISKHMRLPGVGTKRQIRRPQSPYCWVHRKQHWCRITRS